MTTEQILEVLASTPGRLAAITAGATAADLRRPPKPREWSMTELLAHLRACADVFGGAILTILDDEDATIRAINPTTWIKGTDYPTLEFGASLSAFRRQRHDCCPCLGGSTRPRGNDGRPWWAPARRSPISIQAYADRMARHERAHWRQAAATIAAVRR